MSVEYKINAPITTEHFLELLKASTLGERRPIDDYACIYGMINNSNLVITAWEGQQLIGIARSMTDFHFACYLSDLAVDTKYQKQGIGKKLIAMTQAQLGAKCKLILIAAPAANLYYAPLGFDNNQKCWVLEPDKHITL